MKSIALSLLALTVLSSEVFAQRAPRREGPSRGDGRVQDRPGRDDGRPGPGGDRPSDHRRPDPRYDGRGNNRPDRYEPRYDPRPDYRPGRVNPRYTRGPRYYRQSRRPVIIWNTGFGYTCDNFSVLRLNGRYIHNFTFSSDCYTAVNDIRMYGDFCDGSDLYDQSGILEASFYYNYECREALGYYY